MRRRTELPTGTERPQDANFIEWSCLLMDVLLPGSSNKELRHHLKSTARETWQLVNWLTHGRDANAVAASIAVHATDTVVGHYVQVLQRSRTDEVPNCPTCKSRHVCTH